MRIRSTLRFRGAWLQLPPAECCLTFHFGPAFKLRAFITTATGFIGTHPAELLLRSGDQVRGATAQGKWHKNVPDKRPAAMNLLTWDVTNPAPQAVTDSISEFASHLDLIDVRDASRDCCLLANRGVSGKAYNLGSGIIRRSGDVLDTILAMMGRQVHIIEVSNAEQWYTNANAPRLHSLGWRPILDYERSLAGMIPDDILNTPSAVDVLMLRLRFDDIFTEHK